jgi:hypothetical protein
MKIGRSIGVSVSILVVIIIAAVIYILSSLDAIVAGAIQKYGSEVTQTPVRVTAVSIDLKAGSGSIEQLSVGNPDGFSSPHIFTLEGISTDIDVASIRQDPIVIELIHINTPAVFYEINKAGASNLKELQNNIEQSTGGGAGGSDKTAAETPESSGPKLVIRKLVIESGKIEAQVAALGDKPLSADLPRIQLNNIGEKSGGATGDEIARQVIDAIIARAGPAVANLGLEKYLGKNLDEAKALLGDKVGDQVSESLGDKLKENTGGLNKLLGK